ncbi:hypothetical protein DAPPUDRAFT_116424 [Daphnia pulex]|uniref:Uncharacterized protein n=1 Tax=Daphnia pulex TaxID=6669 RepID=E9HPD0_DAPPU|nr:hypothetical protein DAPPUDRAFT_116424 [Daphnia pulex]|eukprot:EFX66423.1 hypothetical protein DAPPUDRAFT_116424 [Daphnia pulex]
MKKKKTLMISLFIRVPCDTLQKREKVTMMMAVGGEGGECWEKGEKRRRRVTQCLMNTESPAGLWCLSRMMAECYDQDSSEDRYRLLHRRLATAYRPAPPPPVPPHPPDDDESHQVPAPVVAESAAAAAQLFGGSFQFIVQEQAKSMVAIQELQQEVGSLLLFRQAVLAALPHLHQQPNNLLAKGKITAVAAAVATANNNNPIAAAAAATTITGGQSWTRRKQQHLQQQQQQQQQQLTGGGGYRSLQDGSSDQPTASAIIASSSSNNPVADSGFSTEASNSNTSPRSSRFDTTSSSEMTMSHHSGQQQQQQPQQHQPMEKELLQHLERVQQRLARLRKDEDRLQTLLNLKRMANGNLATATTASTSSGHDDDDDELWHLLEEIQLRSQAIRSSGNDGLALKDAVNKPEEAIQQQQQQQQPMSHKKRVSFQQQQQLLETEGGVGGVIASVDGLPSPAGKSSTGPVVVVGSSTASSSGSSSSSSRYQPPSRDQVATILRLTNPVQLQRHLLRALLDNQTLREQVENGRCDAESRDAQWRTKSQVAVEQMTALRDENEDLRFQLEEQKIELEGTKARLRMLNRVPSPSNAQQHRVNGGPAVTSVRVRATSTQTERPSTLLLHNHPAAMSSPVLLQSVKQSQLHISHFSQGTQTMTAMSGPELSPEDNNNKVVGGVGGGGRALPRVVDASPKPPKLLSKLVDLAQGNGKVNGSGSSWGDPDEERPSVEGGRRSYSSRIPTPIKPTVIPVTTTLLSVTPTGPSPSSSAAVNVNNYNYNNNNSSSSKALPSAAVATLAAATTPSKRELPDIPVMMTTPNKMATVLHSTKSSPVTPQQLGSKLHHHHHLQQRGSKSEPANVPATTKVLPTTTSSTPSTEIQQQQQLPQQQQQQQQTQQSSVILHHPHHSSNHPRPVKSSFWGAWWKL